MAPVTFSIDPVTRIEGHLKVTVTVEDDGTVSDVKCKSQLYRGLENILKRRDPRDAPVIVQRI